MAARRLRSLLLAALVVLGVLAPGVGLSTDQAEAQTARHQVRVSLVDEDGRPVAGMQVAAEVYGEGPGEYESRVTAAGGALLLWLAEGVYHLRVLTDRHTDCTVFGPENPEGEWPAVLTVEGGGSSQVRVVLSEQEPLDTLRWLPCHFDVPYYPIQGTVLGPGDEPMERVSVYTQWQSRYDAAFGGVTASDGSFEIEAPEGFYESLRFSAVVDGKRCDLGSAGLDGEHTFGHPSSSRLSEQQIVIDGEAVTGITVRFPGALSDLCRRIEGRVSTRDGKPLRDVWVGASGRGPLSGRDAGEVTGSEGGFSFRGPDGRYTLRIQTEAGSECTITGVRNPEGGPPDRIDVAGADVTSIDLVISGAPGPSWEFVYCQHPAELVTTELTPGWNLAGWTKAEADISAIFSDIPQLEESYAWDGATQSFLEAVRDGADISGSLSTLQPGMGLWLYIGGAEPVEWKRTVLPEGGLVSLAEGWNLVAWSGQDRLSAEDALASLGEKVGAAAAWDAAAGQFTLYSPVAPAGETSRWQLARGGGLWLYASRAGYWLQPGSVGPAIEFGDGYSPSRQGELQAMVSEAFAIFAHRFGVVVPDLTVRYTTGETGPLCAYGSKVIHLTERCFRAIGHEYSHAIQEHLAPSVDRGPAWLIEGVANRWSAQYHEIRGYRTHERHLQETTHRLARKTPIPLEDLVDTLRVGDYTRPNYNIAHIAVNRLVDLTGEDRTFRYHQERASYGSWQEAFREVFGLGIDEFYADFADYRAEYFATEATVRGRVVGPDGQPLADVRIFGEPSGDNGSGWSATTSEDGTFESIVSDGTYLISVTDFSLAEDCHFGWYDGDSSLVVRRGQALAVRVDGADVEGIVIGLAADPSVLASELCSRVRGVILGPGREPVEGVHALLVRQDDRLTEGNTTGSDGTFGIVAPAGQYYLSLNHGACRLGWYGGRGSPVTRGRELLDVEAGKDITGIEIHLPASVSDLCE